MFFIGVFNVCAKLGEKNQTHVDLGTHSVGKEACCVHLPGSSKIECFSSKGSVYRRGYLSP